MLILKSGKVEGQREPGNQPPTRVYVLIIANNKIINIVICEYGDINIKVSDMYTLVDS